MYFTCISRVFHMYFTCISRVYTWNTSSWDYCQPSVWSCWELLPKMGWNHHRMSQVHLQSVLGYESWLFENVDWTTVTRIQFPRKYRSICLRYTQHANLLNWRRWRQKIYWNTALKTLAKNTLDFLINDKNINITYNQHLLVFISSSSSSLFLVLTNGCQSPE